MHCFNEENPLCTSCHHVISLKEILRRYAYRHPILEVLLCKTCYNRVTNINDCISNKLCVWCGFPGKYTTCSKCSSHFCIKCLKNNFSEDTFKNITKRKNWTCFHCLPELLSEHRSKCTEVLDGMRNTSPLPAKRRRSSSESHIKPLTKHARNRLGDTSSDDDQSKNDFSSQIHKKMPTFADYNFLEAHLMDKIDHIHALFSNVAAIDEACKKKLETQGSGLKVLQQGFTYVYNFTTTIKKILCNDLDDMHNIDNEWKKKFNIPLIIPIKERVHTENSSINETKTLNNTKDYSNNHEKKKKFRLSLKKTFDSENTDDGLTEDINSSVTSVLGDDDLDLDITTENLDDFDEAPENDVIQKPVAPESSDKDSDCGSIFSEKTVIINFDELQPTEPLQNVKEELSSGKEDLLDQDLSSTLILCEMTGNFTTIASLKSDMSQNISNQCSGRGIGEDAGSEISFVFDINSCGSKSPPHHSDCNSNAVSETRDLDINEELDTMMIDVGIKEKGQSQTATDIESAKEIESFPEPTETNVAASNISQIHIDNECDKVTNNPIEEKSETVEECNNKVADKPEPTVTTNEQNSENNNEDKINDKADNEVVDNNHILSPPTLVTDIGSSHDTQIDEPILNNKEGMDTSLKIDIEESPLIKNDISVSDLEINTNKLEFFDGLDLYSNIAEENAKYTKENEPIEEDTEIKQGDDDDNNKVNSKNIKDAIKLLKADDSDLFDSDSDTSTSSVSDEEEEEGVNLHKEPPGRVFKGFPIILNKPVTATSNDDEKMSVDEDDINTENVDNATKNEEDRIKPCSVVLVRLEDIISKPSTSSTSENAELREIERLINLNNIGLKRKGDKPPNQTKLKRRKILTPSGLPASESEMSDFECDLTLPSIPSPPMSEISHEGMLDALINQAEALSDFDLDTSDTDGDGEDKDNKKKKKKKKRSDSAGSNKENQPDNKENDENAQKELTAEELAKAEKKKWKNDPLLRTKLTDSESGTDSDGAVEGDNILTEKAKKKIEALEKKREKRDTHKVARRTSESSQNETDNDVSLSSEIDDDDDADNDVKDRKLSIIINTDTDSDIEFISESKEKGKALKKKSKPKSSVLCISSNEDNDDAESDSENKKKGRKNIRAIQSDETLAEATKKANLLEKQRKDRLSQKQTQLDSIIAESQILSQEEGLILDVDEETKSPIIVVHSSITKRLKNHQKSGVRFMWGNCYESVKRLQKDDGTGCILAHCMGLGKTFQVVALIHTLFAHPITNTKHVIVVCPLSIVLNWKNEFQKGLEGINDNVNINIFCISDRSSGKDRRLLIVDKWREQKGVLIMGYEAYEKLTNTKDSKNKKRQENINKALVNPGPDLVVLDEGHLLKNGKNVRTKALMKVNTKRRIILTGTPMQNNLQEYYHMVQFVKPNLLGSYAEYTNRFVNPITNGQFHDSTEGDTRKMKNRSHVLFKMLKGTVQRFEVTELEPYLPSKFDYVLFIQPHIIQAQLYEKYLDLIKSETGVIKGNLINNFHKLHVLWTHPCLLHLRQEQKKSQKKSKEVDVINLDPEINDADESPEGWWQPLCPEDYKTNIEYGPKFKVMLAIIRECEKVGDKLLIFSNSIIELDAIEIFLQQHATPTSQWKPKKDYYRMDGTVNPDVRLQLCNDFNDSKNLTTRVFLISNRVGGLGLNLVAANRVILMDVNWNPAYDIQSVFRIYRFGQTKQCFIYRLISMGTMEEVVYQRQVNKLALAGRVIDEMQIPRHYKSDDLQKMYRLQYNIEQERPPLPIPPDMLLATVILECEEIFKYHEHQSLLENKPEEELDENEMKLAWEEFYRENDNHKRQIEERRLSMLPAIAGPSGINPFLPRPVGPPNVNPFQNNYNNNVQYTQVREGSAQPEFEVVLIQESRPDGITLQPCRIQKTAQATKPKELSQQFYNYIKQFHHQTESGTPQENTAIQPPANVNHTNNSIPPTATQGHANKGVVLPQIVNSFTGLQTPTKNMNVGYILPPNIASTSKKGRPFMTYGGRPPVLMKRVPANSSVMGNSIGNNIQTAVKTQPVNAVPKKQSVVLNKINQNGSVISRSSQFVKKAQEFSPSTSNTVGLQKNERNIKNVSRKKQTGNAFLSDTTPPSLKGGHKTMANHGVVINDNFTEIIDVDAEIPLTQPNVTKQQELINTLNNNLDITLSLREKPNQNGNTVIEMPKPIMNSEGNAISIMPIAKNITQSNCNDVIEID